MNSKAGQLTLPYNVRILLYKFTGKKYNLYIVHTETNSFQYNKLEESRSRSIVLCYISIVPSSNVLVLYVDTSFSVRSSLAS